ncbi:hypothetical protein JG687_00018921 [Phytophthora cactorum]|uniref:Uncharacterized protein n=1 Tax=Phytophthora cactorum TaxID=29920 RepID=A0A8T1TPA8_9STRA|nr:hypothetical protein JG687_00018921 [Phytophthora cactorum]
MKPNNRKRWFRSTFSTRRRPSSSHNQASTMQRRHQLSPEEKALVCNVYDYFVAEAKEGRSGGRNSRQRTKEATRFGKSTIFRVLRARNINPNTDFVEVRLPFSPM